MNKFDNFGLIEIYDPIKPNKINIEIKETTKIAPVVYLLDTSFGFVKVTDIFDGGLLKIPIIYAIIIYQRIHSKQFM